MVSQGATQVFVHHSKNNETCEYDIIESSSILGHDKSLSLSFFHSFSGCDTTSDVFHKGKISFWDVWIGSKNNELTQTFIQLSNLQLCRSHIYDRQSYQNIYLMKVYFGQRCNYVDINEARINSFFNTADPNLRTCIMSRSALWEHAKRSALQAGWLWRECVENVIVPDPRNNEAHCLAFIPC